VSVLQVFVDKSCERLLLIDTVQERNETSNKINNNRTKSRNLRNLPEVELIGSNG
jgi:hypothetical protein